MARCWDVDGGDHTVDVVNGRASPGSLYLLPLFLKDHDARCLVSLVGLVGETQLVPEGLRRQGTHGFEHRCLLGHRMYDNWAYTNQVRVWNKKQTEAAKNRARNHGEVEFSKKNLCVSSLLNRHDHFLTCNIMASSPNQRILDLG